MESIEEELGTRYLGASAAVERGETERARRDFEIILLDAPRFAPAWDGLGCCYEAEGDLSKAGECFRKAIQLDRGNWRSRYNWGAALHRAGELRKACRWLGEAARVAPAERRILQRLGLCYFDLGQYEDALAWYRRALDQPERDISDTDLYVRIGDAEAEVGNFEAADKAYERACLFSPDDPMIFYNWALLAVRREEPGEAERLAVRARALDPRSLRHRMLLIDLALDAARWDAARTRIEELEELAGTGRLQQALRAELARRMGDGESARRLALASLAMDGPPSDLAVESVLGTLRHLRGLVAPCRGYRLLIEVENGDQIYYRPYVVLAETEEQARWFAAELQDSLDPSPWRIVETEHFPHEGETLAGVCQVLLTRVLFPRDSALPSPARVQFDI